MSSRVRVSRPTAPLLAPATAAASDAVTALRASDIVPLQDDVSAINAELRRGRTSAAWVNELVSVLPTMCVQPYNYAGSAQFATTLAGTAAASKDDETLDPTTGLSTLKLVLGVGDDATQTLRWDSLASTWSLGADDVYLLPIKLDSGYLTNDNMYLRLRFTKEGVPSTHYRSLNLFGGAYRPGWQILVFKNTETGIGASEYGNVGTCVSSEMIWYDYGTMTSASTVNGFRIEVINGAGLTINVGALHRAPAGWCKSVVIWSEDDGWLDFHTLGRPILEAYGWPVTHNIITGDTQGGVSPNFRIDMSHIRTLIGQGDEFWAHAANHSDLVAADSQTRAKLLREAAAWGVANGLQSVARYIAYPFGSYNSDVITAAQSAGYKIGRGGNGRFHCSWVPGLSLMCLPSINLEKSNSWHADAYLNGAILRGQAVFAYLHQTVAGGSGVDTYPTASKHYTAHLQRWADLVKAHEDAGRVVCMTATQYIRACGLDLSLL